MEKSKGIRKETGAVEFLKGKSSQFIEEQIRLSEVATKNTYEALGLDSVWESQNLPYPFPLLINLKKDERLGVRQIVSGGHFFVVEDINGSFKRIYNE